MLIHPPETVTVDLGALHTVATTLHAAARQGEQFRAEITAARRAILRGVAVPAYIAHGPLTVDVHAEPLWWLVQGAEEIGHEHGLSPVGVLFDAVEYLTDAIADQAPRTDYGLTAVVEAEATCAIYEHVITDEGDHRG